MKAAILALALVAVVQADIYLQNPRGSNNRLDEARRERNNANRLFDSQNNNRGGYNVGNLYYYEGSILPIEWTNQHSCADQNSHCDVIIQYMCDSKLRDGSSTNTIPDSPANCEGNNCNNDLEFGMHEDYDYFLGCRTRSRNMGLFTAERRLNGNSARFTRQNNNGQRRGYECPEERDYYPYWHPTPWRDVAILTNNVQRCVMYQQESENVKSRYYCDVPRGFLVENRRNNNGRVPNNREACEILRRDSNANDTIGWMESPAHGLPPPECMESFPSRDNHLGNTRGGYPIYYNWTVPRLPHQHCALRIRYNISTADYDAWEDPEINHELRRMEVPVYNGGTKKYKLTDEHISNVSNVYTRFGMDYDEARMRGYVFRQNPVVRPFPAASNGTTFGLQLAINTHQFGRTFQDRSHSFEIRKRPADIDEDAAIFNLNVRGKRGNIVQTYPGTEYDFVPNVLRMSEGDYVHIQWTGSNTNPNNNDGQGKQGTDRSNMVLLRETTYPEGIPEAGKVGHWGRSYPQHLNHTNLLLNLTFSDRQALAGLTNVQMGGEMSELDDAGTYFDLGPRRMTEPGIFRYLCTRNNNFTNRSQKGLIAILLELIRQALIGWNGGTIRVNNHTLIFERGDVTVPNAITMKKFTNASSAIKELEGLNPSGNPNPPANILSPFISIDPPGRFDGLMNPAKVSLNLDNSVTTSDATIYRAGPDTAYAFVSMETTIIDGKAEASTSRGGVFVVGSAANVGFVVGLVVLGVVLLLMALVTAGVIVYFVARPEKWQAAKKSIKTTHNKVKRSFARRV